MNSDLTIQQFARLTQYHPESLRRLCRSGKLVGAYAVGRRWRIRSDAADWLRGIRAKDEEVRK